ncbi:MAG: Transcriptional regulator, MerR family, partial [uncultured Chloroflexi bacterium]
DEPLRHDRGELLRPAEARSQDRDRDPHGAGGCADRTECGGGRGVLRARGPGGHRRGAINGDDPAAARLRGCCRSGLRRGPAVWGQVLRWLDGGPDGPPLGRQGEGPRGAAPGHARAGRDPDVRPRVPRVLAGGLHPAAGRARRGADAADGRLRAVARTSPHCSRAGSARLHGRLPECLLAAPGGVPGPAGTGGHVALLGGGRRLGRAGQAGGRPQEWRLGRVPRGSAVPGRVRLRVPAGGDVL